MTAPLELTAPKPPRSAKGLFKATGNASTVGDEARVENDFYPTPPEPTRAFLHVEREWLAEAGLIWEPAAGDGAMVREMVAAGLPVVASDLVDRGCPACIVRNFYDFDIGRVIALRARGMWQRPKGADAKARTCVPTVVTNPPFCECNSDGKFRWFDHAWSLGIERMALLLPVHWACPAKAGRWWAKWRPARVWQMTWKIDFTGMGSPPSYHAWFVWDGRDRTDTRIDRLDRAPAQEGLL